MGRREKLAVFKAREKELNELIPALDKEIEELCSLRVTLSKELGALNEDIRSLRKKIYYKG